MAAVTIVKEPPGVNNRLLTPAEHSDGGDKLPAGMSADNTFCSSSDVDLAGDHPSETCHPRSLRTCPVTLEVAAIHSSMLYRLSKPIMGVYIQRKRYLI